MLNAARGGLILGLSLSAVTSTVPLTTAAPTPASQPSAPLATRVEQLLQRLDSDSFTEREAAAEEADRLPLEALPLLEKAIRKAGVSPDVRTSLAGVVAKLRQLASTQSHYTAAVDWFRAQYGQQYERVGEKDPTWDGPASRLLDEAAKFMAAQLLNRFADDAAFDAAAEVRKTKCPDPLVRYLALRFDRQPQLKPLKDLWPAMKASDYSAHRKLSHAAYVVSAAAASRRPPVGDRLMVRPFLVAAAELWPTVLEDSSFPTTLAIRQLQALLDDARQAGIERKDAFDLLDAQLAKALPDESLIRLNVRGYHLVRLASELRAASQTDIESDAATRTIDQAEKILNRCYELYPDDTNAPSTMLWLESFHGRGLEFFDTWFERAVKADPQNYGAYYKKLTYLEPTSYGTDEQYLAFARECLATAHFETRIPLLVVEAHKTLEEGGEWASLAPKPYYARPDVWDDIRLAYEGFLRHYPEAHGDRYDYAELAYNAGQWMTAAEQYRILQQTPSWSKRNTGLVRLINLELPIRLAEKLPQPDPPDEIEKIDRRDTADYRRAMVDAYEAFGRKSEKWDHAARAVLEATVAMQGPAPERNYGETDVILQMGHSAIEAGCDDPLVRFLHAYVVDDYVMPRGPEFVSTCFPHIHALLASDYPELTKVRWLVYALSIKLYTEDDPGAEAKVQCAKLLQDAVPMLATVVREGQARPGLAAFLAGRLLDQVWATDLDLTPYYEKLDRALAEAKLPPEELQYLQAKYLGEYASARIDDDDEQAAARERKKRLDAAVAFTERAWTARPQRRYARLLVDLARDQKGELDVLRFWTRQALLGNPYSLGTALDYIDAVRPSSQLEGFARAAADTNAYRTQLPFALVEYRIKEASRGEDGKRLDLPDVDKISDEDVWADIANVFESYLAKYPLDSDKRSQYASLACRAGRWSTAIQQFDSLGGKIRPRAFGTQGRFEACRNKITSFAPPATQPDK